MSAVSPDVSDGSRSDTSDGIDRVPRAPVRDRYVDLVRVTAVVAVILGHWFVIAITIRDGRLGGQNVLALLPWTHGLTWVFQVVPLFFLVGGYANAASWTSFNNAGAGWTGWLCVRGERLLRPTTIYLATALLATTVARVGGVDPVVVDDAAWLVAIHLWFLAIYLVVVAAAPMMLAAHRRWGATVVVLLVGAVAAVDVLRLGFDVPHIGMLNYALVWAAIHQVGFLWRDGALPHGAVRAAALAGAGLLALIVMTGPGPYPVSMVNVPGAGLQPTAPPGLSILALAAFQAGVVLGLRHPAERWLARPRPRAVVARFNGVVMTLFLWHLVPVVVGAAILYATALIPQAEIGSGSWLALHVVWIAVLAFLLAALVAIFGRFERRSHTIQPARANGLLAVAAMTAAAVGLAVITLQGFTEPGALGVPVLGVASYVAALVFLTAAARQRKHDCRSADPAHEASGTYPSSRISG
jgi:hypothetical protein